MNDPIPARPILLADDNEEDLFFLRRKLTKIGVTNPIVSVEDGFEAIRLLKACSRRPDASLLLPCILFLDIKMPGVTGFSVLSWIRSREPLNVVKVVMVSDSGEPSDIELATELGANAYLIKYPTSDSLVHVLTTIDRAVMINRTIPAAEEENHSQLARGYAIPLVNRRPAAPAVGTKVGPRS